MRTDRCREASNPFLRLGDQVARCRRAKATGHEYRELWTCVDYRVGDDGRLRYILSGPHEMEARLLRRTLARHREWKRL